MVRARLAVSMTTALVLAALVTSASAQLPQGGGRGGGAAPGGSGRTQAPFDLSGYWVALVTDDWRYRMLTPPKGNVDYLPVSPEGRKVADAWDPAKDEAAGEACRGYGAGGIMRLPGRLHITWENDNVMRMDIDTGTQTRRFAFGPPAATAAEPTWQGTSTARWQLPFGGFGRGRGPATTGQLVVTTTKMKPGYMRKNGIPYGPDAVLTEYFVRLVDTGGQEYLAVTTMLEDPRYLLQPYVKTYEYKKQPDASGWDPTPCVAR